MNVNSGEASSQGNNGPPPAWSSSTNANVTQDESEAHDNDNEIGTEEGTTFPQKLMDALEQETSRDDATFAAGGARIFAWSLTGDAFVIRDKASFEEEVLTKYFNKCKFMSFTRKLYRWGFRQINKDTQSIKIFHHVHFVRGDKQRCLKMRSLVKSPPTSYRPQGHVVAPYNAVHEDQHPVAFCFASGQHKSRIATSPEDNAMGLALPTSHRALPLQATAPRVHSGGVDILSPPRICGQGRRAPSSLLEGRTRLEEIEQTRKQIMDMLNNRSQRATAARLQSGNGDLLSFRGVLGLGGRPSSSLRTSINQVLQGNTGAAATEIAEGRRCLQETERGQQQRMDMLNHNALPASATYLPRGGNDLLSPRRILELWGRPSSSLRAPIDQLLRGNTGAASTEVHEGRCPIQENEQKRQHLVDMLNHRNAAQAEQSRPLLLDVLNNNSAARATAPPFDHLPAPPLPSHAAMAQNHNYRFSYHQKDASDEVVRLAAEIMKRGGPGTEQWRALELARQVRANNR